MASENRFGILRRVLRAIGLSPQKSEDAVNFIGDLLASEDKTNKSGVPSNEFPYHLRDDLVSPAERSFFEVLRSVVGDRAVILIKVGLKDLFWVKNNDYRYTNKIDRKHVDFVLCDPKTMRPVVAIELDDKSHQREDRKQRDQFVDNVFKVVKLPLVRIPAKRAYNTSELMQQLAPYLSVEPQVAVVAKPLAMPKSSVLSETPPCPKCGGEMVLRTTKKGADIGKQFWGCVNYPNCRSVLAYEG